MALVASPGKSSSDKCGLCGLKKPDVSAYNVKPDGPHWSYGAAMSNRCEMLLSTSSNLCCCGFLRKGCQRRVESIGWCLYALQKHCVQKAEVNFPKGETLSRNFEAGSQAVSTAVVRGRVLQERCETRCADV